MRCDMMITCAWRRGGGVCVNCLSIYSVLRRVVVQHFYCVCAYEIITVYFHIYVYIGEVRFEENRVTYIIKVNGAPIALAVCLCNTRVVLNVDITRGGCVYTS